MSDRFHNREHAGQLLAAKLGNYANRQNLMVIGLPRGGVPVAAVIAKELSAPLDILVVRKLGMPGNEELALGAITMGGLRVLNADILDSMQIPDEVIEEVERREQHDLARRENIYRGVRPMPEVEGKTVLLVDDGIATGATMKVAISAMRLLDAARIVVAVPVAASSTRFEIEKVVDEFVSVFSHGDFGGVGQWYEDFSQTTDDEVRELLAASARNR